MRWAVFILLASCGEELVPPTPTPFELAEAKLPSARALHATVIRRSCSPNRGVCHNSSSYPDLSTPASWLQTLGAPCNLEIADPLLGWDACERRADWLVADGVRTELASAERLSPGIWRFALRLPATTTTTTTVRFEHADGSVALDFGLLRDRGSVWARGDLTAGSLDVVVSIGALIFQDDVRIELDSLLAGLVVGDPNQNGVFGAEGQERGAVITAFDPEASYLWRRINGTVPGTRMPLANQALGPEEYVAISCWIRSGGGETIDYRRCSADQ